MTIRALALWTSQWVPVSIRRNVLWWHDGPVGLGAMIEIEYDKSLPDEWSAALQLQHTLWAWGYRSVQLKSTGTGSGGMNEDIAAVLRGEREWALVQGDCLEILPTLPKGCVDAVVTDPPYEGLKGGTMVNHPGLAKVRQATRTVGTELGNASGLLESHRVARLGAIAFCSYHWIERCLELLLGERLCLISWYKRNAIYSVNNAPWFMTEYAWAVQYAPGIDWRGLRTHIDEPVLAAGCLTTERIVHKGKAVHPAQKPVRVMQALLLPGMEIVLDPFAGLGTTGVACLKTGRRFIGIELDGHYCDIARRRLETAAADQRDSLFPAREAGPQQRTFADILDTPEDPS